MLYQITRPWAYICISGHGKLLTDFIIPVCLSFVTTVLVCFASGVVNVFGAGGLISSLTAFVQNLPGFFIAALSVVATFQKKEMDYFLAPPTPEISIKIDGRVGRIKVTRRRFLCLLFSFLTAQSIVLTILGIGLTSFAAYAKEVFIGGGLYISLFSIFSYFFIFFQMVIVTFWGLYYLSEKMFQGETPAN